MGENLKFALSEIDSKGVAIFDFLCAKEDVETVAELARLILKHSRSDEIKQSVRQKFTALLATRYASILEGGAAGLSEVHAKQLNIYLNRAQKKLDISKDIPIFSEMAGRYVAEHITQLHFDRLYTLFQAVRNAISRPGDIVELGVYRGGSLKFIAETLRAFGAEKRLMGFDTFSGHARVTEEDGHTHWVGLFKTGGLAEVAAYLADDTINLVAGDASATFPEYARTSAGISLAHFDMDLYQPTADALPKAFDLLAPGGIILLDDYGFTSCPGVKIAVDEFLSRVQATTVLHLMTGQLVIVK